MKTDEQIQEGVGAVYGDKLDKYSHPRVEVLRADDSIFVKVVQMYDAPQHGLGLADFVKAMTEAVGLPEMVEHHTVGESGCETCDYGSSYGTVFRFFTPA